MKYIVILGDGMADLPMPEYENKTVLELAEKPNIDALAKKGTVGTVKTVPDGMKPGSDVANLSVMGYDPSQYYTGRSPIEAVSMGIKLDADDIAVRCNLVTLSDGAEYEKRVMLDYSADEISTEEASELIAAVDKALGDQTIRFYAGVSYRHCMVKKHGVLGTSMTPPHDISDRPVTGHLPEGENGELFLSLMKRSYEVLKDHPVNKKRMENGKKPANSIWLWGEGTRPELKSFQGLYGRKGAVISAVDLIKGIGIAAGMRIYEVEGATGNIDTNFEGKAQAAVKALEDGADYVYLHIEAPDECGHRGETQNKILSIELIDRLVVAYVRKQADSRGWDYRILVMPDHPTPVSTKTHSSDPIPFALFDSRQEKAGCAYCERTAAETGVYFDSGEALAKYFLEIENE